MVVIRPAEEQDLPSILELYRQLSLSSHPEENGTTADELKVVFERVKAFNGLELLAAEEDGRVVGTVVMLVVPNLSHNGKPWAVLENMVVEQGRRGTGIGRKLIEEARRRAEAAGCYKIQLASTNSRKAAHAFYRSVGFKASAKGFRLYL